MLLDPFEEQLHLPAHLVQLGFRQRFEIQMVGDEHQLLAGLGIFETDAAQRPPATLFGIEEGQGDRVVADHPGTSIGLAPDESPGTHVSFGTSHEERACLMESGQTFEVDIGATDDVEGAGLGDELIENVDGDQFLDLLLGHPPVLPSQAQEERIHVTLKDSGSEPCLTAVGSSGRPPYLAPPDEGAQINGHVDTNRPDTASP